jgi:LmbE family N-acetylglucosaminyl deacetylase
MNMLQIFLENYLIIIPDILVMTMNILAIGAHPDDIELGCGGLLLKAAKQGHHVNMYTLTHGSHSGDPVERIQELKESAKAIAVQTLFIDNFEDTKLQLNSDLINHIESVIKVIKADIIYTHSKTDNHHDHRAIAEATIEAGRYVPNILAYEMPATKDFSPHVYYDISDVIDDKIRLINIFLSQQDKMFITSNAIRGLAQYRALQSRLEPSITSVESFEVLKLSFEKDFKLLNTRIQNIPRHSILSNFPETIETVYIDEQYSPLYDNQGSMHHLLLH